MDKPAKTQYPVLDPIEQRWSPRAFSEKDVEVEDLRSCLEAARWSPSCFNEQPWRFIVARREDEYDFRRLADCLMPGNVWAKQAGALVLSAAAMKFAHNGNPNRHAYHDVGLATAHFVLQATVLGLAIHQMAGFDREKARESCSIPADFDPVTMLAVGYVGTPGQLSEELQKKEIAPRVRRPQSEFVFDGLWGKVLQ